MGCPRLEREGKAHSGAPACLRVDAQFSWSDVLEGTQGAPWLWWAAALVVLLGLLLLGMKLFGLFPE